MTNFGLQGIQVPFARDGSCFHPGLKRNGTYTVGNRTDELHIEEFGKALFFLQQMTVAAWRRPNPEGNWGIVASIRWGDLPEVMGDVPTLSIQNEKRNVMTETIKPKTKDFYAEKGMARYTMILGPAHKDKIENVAKTYGISQGNVIEVLLDQMDESLLGSYFEAKKTVKGTRQGAKGAIVAKLKGLTPEQLRAAEAYIASLSAQSSGAAVK